MNRCKYCYESLIPRLPIRRRGKRVLSASNVSGTRQCHSNRGNCGNFFFDCTVITPSVPSLPCVHRFHSSPPRAPTEGDLCVYGEVRELFLIQSLIIICSFNHGFPP